MSTSSKMTEYADRRVWNIEGHAVTQLHLDYSFAFECWWYGDNLENNRLYVKIENVFTIQYPDGAVVCDPEDVNSVKETIAILHKPVSLLTAYRDGRLVVDFVDGTELTVLKDRDYESWEAQGYGELADLALLCSPHDGPPWNENHYVQQDHSILDESSETDQDQPDPNEQATSSRPLVINQGEIYWIQLDDLSGAKPGIPHPYVIIQDNIFNHSRINTLVACALTSNLKRANTPGNVLLDVGEANLLKQSVVEVSKITTVNKTQLGKYIGSLTEQRINQILAGMRFLDRSFFARQS